MRRVRLRELDCHRVVEGSGFLDSAGSVRVGTRLADGTPHDDTGLRGNICPRDNTGAPDNTGVAEDT